MPRFKLTIEYDGTGLAGWQKQPDKPSVQEYLERAAEKLTGTYQEIIAAGRTDAGVHALAQVVHIDIARAMTPYNVMHGINFHLLDISMQIIVTHAEQVPDDFHARFSAKGRQYIYRIINRPVRLAVNINRAWHIPEPLDAQAMHDAAQLLLGSHDFTTFRSTMCQAASPLKTLDKLDVTRNGEEISIHVHARSFLHNQVHNMVGSLRLVGNGKWTKENLSMALQACDRTKGGETAQPQGLYLAKVVY